MVKGMMAAFVTASLLSVQVLPGAALADNQMGYQTLTVDQAIAC